MCIICKTQFKFFKIWIWIGMWIESHIVVPLLWPINYKFWELQEGKKHYFPKAFFEASKLAEVILKHSSNLYFEIICDLFPEINVDRAKALICRGFDVDLIVKKKDLDAYALIEPTNKKFIFFNPLLLLNICLAEQKVMKLEDDHDSKRQRSSNDHQQIKI